MQRRNFGFTLIELMIVLAVVSVLTALAIPTYQQYVMRSQIGVAVTEIAGYRAAFERLLLENGQVTNQNLGYVPSKLTSGDTSNEIGVLNGNGSGYMQVTMGEGAHPNLNGVVLRHVRSANGTWSCEIDPSGSAIFDSSLIPIGCEAI